MARCRQHGVELIGGVCQRCDGQPQVLAYEIAQALADKFGPRRRDDRRANQYGGKGVIKFAPTEAETRSLIKQNVTLVDWQSADGEPHPVTVEVGRIAIGGGGSFPQAQSGGVALSYRPRAQVIIGQPSVMSDPFFIDINRGQRFTAAASYLAVTAEMLAPPAGGVSGSMSVLGGIGFGQAVTIAPVVITQYIDSLAALAVAAPIVVPPRCNFLLPLRSSDQNNLMLVEFLDTNSAVIDVLQFSNGQMVAPAPLSADTYSVRVTNQGAVAASYRLIFQVDV